jgi:hypothetical protein
MARDWQSHLETGTPAVWLCLAFSFLIGLDFELRASYLQSWHSTPWATPPVHFYSGYFGDGALQTDLGLQTSQAQLPK